MTVSLDFSLASTQVGCPGLPTIYESLNTLPFDLSSCFLLRSVQQSVENASRPTDPDSVSYRLILFR